VATIEAGSAEAPSTAAPLIDALDEQARIEQERIERARRTIAVATRRLDLVARMRELAEQLADEFDAGDVPPAPASRPRRGATQAVGAELRGQIRAFVLSREDPVTSREVQEALGAGQGVVDKHLRALLAEGVIAEGDKRDRSRTFRPRPGRTEGSGSSAAAAPPPEPASSSNGAKLPPGPQDEVILAELRTSMTLAALAERLGVDGSDRDALYVRVAELEGKGEVEVVAGARRPRQYVAVARDRARASQSSRADEDVAGDEGDEGEPAGVDGASSHAGRVTALSPRVARLEREERETPPAAAMDAAQERLRGEIERQLLREWPLTPKMVAARLVRNTAEVAAAMAELRRLGVLQKGPGGGYQHVDRPAAEARLAEKASAA
jgi:predicted transcriptional regulator